MIWTLAARLYASRRPIIDVNSGIQAEVMSQLELLRRGQNLGKLPHRGPHASITGGNYNTRNIVKYFYCAAITMVNGEQ